MNPVLLAIAALADSSNPEAETHRRLGLVRTSGSYIPWLAKTWEATRTFLESQDWEEISWKDLPPGAGIPIARYFRAPNGGGVHNTMTVGEARARGIPLESRIHKPSPDGTGPNPRGLGVFAEVRAEDVQEVTNEVWVILGPAFGEDLAPWTWHPGPPAVPVSCAHYEALDSGRWDDPGLQVVNVHLLQ